MEEHIKKDSVPGSVRQLQDDEIDLVQLVQILLKRKWLIIVITVLLTVSAAGITMLMPNVYAVSAILEPTTDSEGNLLESPQTIRENITGGAYDHLIIDELALDADKFPKLKVTVPKQTNLVKVMIESSKPDRALAILNLLFVHVKKGVAQQIDIRKNIIENELQTAKNDKKMYSSQINKVKELIIEIEKKISEMEKIRKTSMSAANSDSTSILLYLNEIQNKQVFLNILYRDLAELENKSKDADIEISDKHLKLSNIKDVVIRKAPEVSRKPIKPKKKLIVTLALIVGLMGGIMLAFIAEFMTKVREQQ